MTPRKTDGFTVIELTIVLLVASVVLTLTIGTFVSQTRLRRQFDHVVEFRERQALALNAVGDWIGQASAVLGRVGTVATDPNTLNLELPDRDAQGFREPQFDTVTIQASDGNLAIAILPASGSVRSRHAFLA
ncbi:MAG: type II secretion system GspH family protein, partial [Cyanobacteria bacterium REEB65]|nr:type II secretion system GspH family protein [Cyanobacteria bacterium REEB65]